MSRAKPRDGGGGAGLGAVVTTCFAAATFLGAFLLFLVQPLIARYVLPWFGGGAAVWTTCMLLFQAALLIGYLYAHLGVRRLPRGAQAIVHIVVLIAAVAWALPSITPSVQWQPSADAAGTNPTWRIVLMLMMTLGLPCVALAATSPLLHAWYGRFRPSHSVYRLYALSNAGSLLALLAYPLIVERYLPRAAQARMWSFGMGLFAVLCATCAAIAWVYRHAVPITFDVSDSSQTSAPPPPGRAILWLLLPVCASALLLGATNTITQDLAPVPFLWVVPLGLYLLTFIIAFDRPGWYRRRIWNTVFAIALVGTLVVMFEEEEIDSVLLLVGTLAFTMFAGCMVMHGELARLRPPPRQLTSYYLTIAAGGALGGLLVAVGAPMLLKSYSEFPLALWTCCLLAFVTPHLAARRVPTGVLGMAGIAGVMAAGPLLWAMSHRPLVGGTLIEQTRDFYGVLSVWSQVLDEDGNPIDPGRVLYHGSITHGHQYDDPNRRGTATTYYYPTTAVGQVLAEEDESPLPPGPRRVAVVGLGTGSLAAYARGAGDTYRFYEISPSVARLARGYFKYLDDATARGATINIALGDARLSLERESDDVKFDVIVLDAFSGDAIPVHLLTTEAFDLYKRHLKPTGLMAVHVSNRYLDLVKVVAAAARTLGWPAYSLESAGPDPMDYPADWIVLGPGAQPIPGAESLAEREPAFVPWTDERANVLTVMR